MKKTLTVIAVLAVGALPLAGPAAAQEEEASTRIDTLEAGVTGSTVNISGTATFVDTPVIVGTDPDGDGRPGADIRSATIERAVGSNALTFTLAVDDLPPAIGAFPNYVYLWPLMINGTDNSYFLMAGRAGGFPEPTTDPGFSLMQNSEDGFLPVARVTGQLGDGVVRWNVPASMLGAKFASTIDLGGGSPAGVNFGLFEVFWLGVAADTFTVDTTYSVAAADVQVGIAPAGTAPDEVELTKSASVNAGAGTFSTTLPTPATAGDHVVVARACYSPGDCHLSSATVTV